MFNIAYCFDENYAYPTLVSARSLLRCSPLAQIHLVHKDVCDETLKWLAGQLPTSVIFHCVSVDSWATKSFGSHISHTSSATNLRLLLPELISVDVERILYIDSDTLVFTDLAPYMSSFEIGISGVAARIGGSMSSNTWGRGLFPRGALAFTAGVLLLDLKLLRELDFCKHCRHLFSKIGNMNDQTLLNLWCRGVFGKLPEQFNLRPEEATDERPPLILHFEGAGGKPWEETYKGRFKSLWDYFTYDIGNHKNAHSQQNTTKHIR
jgi:lipopolysaccharide biosynthesis glycosyltransferase